MSERIRQHNRMTSDPSTVAELGLTHSRRNFIDPLLLAADTATIESGLGALAALAGLGLAGLGVGAGFGIGSYFYQKGEAEKIRARKEVAETSKPRVRVGTPRTESTETAPDKA